MEISVTPVPRQSQPTSFPFLLLTALLFYFFSKSPATPDTQSRLELERAFQRRRLEVIGLQKWLNSSIELDHRWLDSYNSTSNSTEEPVLSSLCYPSDKTFGNATPHAGQKLISDWLTSIDVRTGITSPRIHWNNITGHIRGNWRLRSENSDWYPPPPQGSPDSTLGLINGNSSGMLLPSINLSFSPQRGKFPWIPASQNFTPSSRWNQKPWSSYHHQKIGYNLREIQLGKSQSNRSIIRGTMYFSAPDSRDVALDVEGVRLKSKGQFYMRAWPSNAYLDTRVHLASALDIPAGHFLPSGSNQSLPTPYPPTSEQAQIGELVLGDLLERMRKVEAMLKKGEIPHEPDDHGGSENDQSANCTFIIYAGLRPLASTSTQTAETVLEYEASLVTPTGASTRAPHPSRPILQSLIISPNCGLLLETNEMPVVLAPMFWAKGKMYGYVAGLVMGIQCWLLVWQMDSRQSPSSLARISYLALVTQIIMDAWTFSSHLTLSVVTNNASSQPLLVPAFFACLNAILFGMRYGTLIRMNTPVSRPGANPVVPHDTIGRDADYVQVPTADTEQLVSEPPAPSSEPAPTPPSYLGRLVAFVRNFSSARPVFSLVAITLGLVAVPFVLYSWQPLILCILYSYWLPQIIHNVQHGTSRRGLRKRYIIGTTLCRLLLPLYVWACPENVLFVDPNPWIWLLCTYSLLQATVLVLQDYLGARFFLFGSCFNYEPIWDYHPVKIPSLNDLEHGGSDHSVGEKMPECVICFESIDVLPTSPSINNDDRTRSGSAGEVGLFSRWSYMVPPCHHIAHTKCLENWLAIKSECPVCRRALPPI